jgi:hypothetical protein
MPVKDTAANVPGNGNSTTSYLVHPKKRNLCCRRYGGDPVGAITLCEREDLQILSCAHLIISSSNSSIRSLVLNIHYPLSLAGVLCFETNY